MLRSVGTQVHEGQIKLLNDRKYVGNRSTEEKRTRIHVCGFRLPPFGGKQLP